jgi:beta-lactamase superfamily II metal-dependent hydrolase
MQAIRFSGLCYLVLFLTFGPAPLAGRALAQEFAVTPSERVTRFVNVRAAPSAESEQLARLNPGEHLPLVESVPRWYEVRLEGVGSGFVSKAWTVVVPSLPSAQEELRLHFLSVGAGTCTVVECPGPDAPPMIVDCGSSGGGEMALERDAARQKVQEILTRHTAAPNLVLSHGDIDHYNWIPTVLSGVTPRNIWQGGDPVTYGSGTFPEWLGEQEARGATIHRDFPAHWHNDGEPLGDGLSCGLASTFVLTVNSGGSKNTDSLVLMIEYEDFTAIFPGDAVGVTEEFATANFHGAIKASVLAASHHGAESHRSNGAEWAEATAPDLIVYSSGTRHGHPRCTVTIRYRSSIVAAPAHETHCNTTNDFEQRQVTTTELAEYVTDVAGSIVITSVGRSPLKLTCDLPGCTAEIPH